MLIAVMALSGMLELPAQLIWNYTIPEPDSLRVMRLSALNEEEEGYLPRIIPPSPQSAIYQKYLDHKISECTGIPDISIPLYEIKLKDMTIPITLSYHASGVKVIQYDGDVGAGWSINAGGFKVMRTIYDYEDERYRHYDGNEMDMYANVNEMSAPSDREEKDYKLQWLQNNRDVEYDHFTYILPSSSGEFIIQDGSTDQIKALIAGPQDKFVFSRRDKSYAIQDITITDEQGTFYQLGGTALERILDHPINLWSVIGWPLTKMTTPYKEEINFEYEGYRTYLNERAVNSITYTEAPFYVGILPFGQPASLTGTELPPVDYSDDLEQTSSFITKITTPYCKILFVRRKTPSNTRYSWNQLITAIEIYNNNQLIRKINFEYDLVTENSANRHNMLKEIAISGSQPTTEEKYMFSYYGPTFSAYDHWGYGESGYAKSENHLHNQFKDVKLLYQRALYATAIPKIYNNIYFYFMPNNYYNISFGDRSMKNTPATDYSLQRIIFPTGGFTEYVYEPHTDNYGKHIGGLRVKKITSKPSQTANPIITEFQYSDADFDVSLSYEDFIEESYHIAFWTITDPTTQWPYKAYQCARTLRFSNIPIVGSLLNYKAHYCKVTKLQYDQENEAYNGKTVYVYNNIPVNKKQIIPHRAKITPYSGDGSYEVLMPTYNDFGQGFWIDATKGYSPTLTSCTWYDNNNQIKRKEEYTYTHVIKGTFRELRINQKITWSADFLHPEMSVDMFYTRISSCYDYLEYDLKLGFHRLDSKRTTDYTDSGAAVFDEAYSYNQKHQLTGKKSSNLSESESYRYPGDFTESVYKNMVAANILSPVIEKIKYSNSFFSNEASRTKINYEYRNGIYLPASIQSKTPSVDYRTEISFDRYDAKGNILQCTVLDCTPMVYIWGYEGQYPIAEIKNANYSQITAIISEPVLNTISARLQPTTSDWTLINGLLTNQALQNSIVSTYTYKPQVGMLTETDPAGRITYYDYDSLNRLIRIKDDDGNTLEEYDYYLPNKLIQ